MSPVRACPKNYVKQLLSYTTAAGVGALGMGEVAEGAVIYMDIPDVTISSTPPTPLSAAPNYVFENFRFLNLQTGVVGTTAALAGAGPRVRFQARYRNSTNKNDDGTAGAGDRDARSSNGGGTVLTKVVQDYYLAGFAFGESIGPSTALPATGYLQRFLGEFPYKAGGYSYSGAPFEGYLAVRFVISGNTHYGWVDVETDPGGEAAASVTIKALAYEDTPNTPILAGVTVPEPSSLALLAAGLGALAMNRKRKAA